MGHFGLEVINLGRAVGSDRRLLEHPEALAPDSVRSEDLSANATAFQASCSALSARGGGTIIVPERYYLGKPVREMMPNAPPGIDAGRDLYVPSNVRLLFLPQGQLVPMHDVVLEIEGNIDAANRPIFDVFVPRPDERGLTLERMIRNEAGRVILTRRNLPKVVPEWWGARSAGEGTPSEVEVRRTTRAMQACFDAAWRDRLRPRRAPDGRDFLEALPSVPVVLHGVYWLDDELTVGAALKTIGAAREPMHERDVILRDSFILRGGGAPASSGFEGAARLVAAPWAEAFTREPASGSVEVPHPTLGPEARTEPLTYARRALLGLRGIFGGLVENVAFDAAFTAARCLTVEAIPAPAQSLGVVGCAFRNARTELVHLGGEYLRLVGEGDPSAQGIVVRDDGIAATVGHWGNGQDLSATRFEGCDFETDPGGVLGPEAMRRAELRVSNLTALVFRADQSLPVALRRCRFVGPANPMIQSVGGRLSLVECSFDTSPVAGHPGLARPVSPTLGSPNGTDVFLDAPRWQVRVVGVGAAPPDGVVSTQPTSLGARKVLSRSAQFLATYASPAQRVGSPTQAAVVLRGVRHLPRGPHADRPSI